MELKVDLPALAGQNVDPAAFQRVWNRVMPGEPSPRNDAVPPTAVPAQPSAAPEDVSPPERPSVPECPAEPAPERPSVPECPAEPAPERPSVPECPAEPAPERPSVPECPAEPAPECPSVPECPAEPAPERPSVPDCPAEPAPERPSVPECPAQRLSVPKTAVCPDCPQCPSCPKTPVNPPPALCLGEASQEDSQRLEALMALAQEGARNGRLLARRASGSCAKALSALACDHRLAFRRLSAAYFLITGTRYAPQCVVPDLPASLALALRQQFVWEQKWEQQNKQAAQATADPCLKELYLELAQEGAFHAGTIRSLLEQMCP